MAGGNTRLNRFRRRVTRSDAFVRFLSLASSVFVRALSRTLRIEKDDHPETAALDPTKVLYAFWHGHQFLLLPAYSHQGVAVMTDLSWAGRIQAGLMIRLGFRVVGGSSRRRAVQAVAEMKQTLESGCSGAIAVDGPAGPIYESKPGVLYLARKLGYPIVPVVVSARHSWRIRRAWCLYMVPAPFTKCLVLTGKPIVLAADDVFEPEDLDDILVELTRVADERVGLKASAEHGTPA
jgi:lysophospholipid acyltransferase (LPLAT)-like uncharacterized protein